MPERELKTAPLGLRLRPSLKSALEDLAKADKRPLATYIEIVLEEHVEEKAKGGGKRRGK